MWAKSPPEAKGFFLHCGVDDPPWKRMEVTNVSARHGKTMEPDSKLGSTMFLKTAVSHTMYVAQGVCFVFGTVRH